MVGIEQGLNKLKTLIKQLNDVKDTPLSIDTVRSAGILLIQQNEGLVPLSVEHQKEYLECLEILYSQVKEKYSKKTVEKFIENAIFYVLDLGNNRTREPFEARLDKAIKDIRDKLTAEPKQWTVIIPVKNLKIETPINIGKVRFSRVNESHLEQLKRELQDKVASTSASPEEKNAHLIWVKDRLEKDFSNKTVASITVKACDGEAAISSALNILRLTIDIINFYSDVFLLFSNAYVYLPGEISPQFVRSVACSDGSFYYSSRWIGPLYAVTIEDHGERLTDTDYAKKVLSRIDEILRKDKRNNLEEILISSIRCAGMASTNPRQEAAFLQYMTALESMLLTNDEKSELNYRLGLRAAILTADELEVRKKFKKKFKELYRIRSSIVHSGYYEVTDADLSILRHLFNVCILRILTEDRFISMTKHKELIDHLEESLLSCKLKDKDPIDAA